MNKISKLLSLSAILSISLIAGDDAVINFEKSRISQNPNVKVNDIKISAKKELALAGWYRDWETDRKSTRLNSSHSGESRMPSSA